MKCGKNDSVRLVIRRTEDVSQKQIREEHKEEWKQDVSLLVMSGF